MWLSIGLVESQRETREYLVKNLFSRMEPRHIKSFTINNNSYKAFQHVFKTVFFSRESADIIDFVNLTKK